MKHHDIYAEISDNSYGNFYKIVYFIIISKNLLKSQRQKYIDFDEILFCLLLFFLLHDHNLITLLRYNQIAWSKIGSLPRFFRLSKLKTTYLLSVWLFVLSGGYSGTGRGSSYTPLGGLGGTTLASPYPFIFNTGYSTPPGQGGLCNNFTKYFELFYIFSFNFCF